MKTAALSLLASAICSCVIAQETKSLTSGFIVLKYGEIELTDKNGAKRTIKSEGESVAPPPVILREGETVLAKGDSDCSIVFPSVGTAKLGQDTTVKITPADVAKPDPKKASSIELIGGKLFLDVDAKPLAKDKLEFRLKTPTTILAVKGTQFFADAEKEIETVGVHEGRVVVAEDESGRFIILDRGKAASAKPGGITKDRPLSADEKKLSEFYNTFALDFIPLEKNNRKFSSTYGAQEDANSVVSTYYPKLIKSEKSKELDGSAVKITIQPYPKDKTVSVSTSTLLETSARLRSTPKFMHFMLKSENIIGFQIGGCIEVDDVSYDVVHPDGNVIQFPEGAEPGSWVPFLIPMVEAKYPQKTDGFSFHVNPNMTKGRAVDSIVNVIEGKEEYTIEISPLMIGVAAKD